MGFEALPVVLHVAECQQSNASIQTEGFGVMVRQASLFRQLLRQAPPGEFDQLLRQHSRGDGMLVEADQPLYFPGVVSEDPRRDFADCPQRQRTGRRRR